MDSGARAPALVLLRAGAVPIGRVIVSRDAPSLLQAVATQLPVRIAEAVLHAGLAALGAGDGGAVAPAVDEVMDAAAGALPPRGDRLPVSLVICTRDRVSRLERALRAAVAALGTADELIVVDNAPADDSTATLVRERFPRARLVREPRPGLNWARNRGLVESRSPIIVFSDDDCAIAEPSLAALRAHFARNPEVEILTGLVEPMELETAPQLLFERYFAAEFRYHRRWIMAPRRSRITRAVGNVGQFGTGAILAVRRTLVDRIGPFDAALDVGTESSAGGDMEFLFRALKHGAVLATEPRVAVRHEHRRTLPELETQVEGWSRGFACAMARAGLAFPEERTPIALMLGRIAGLYHARRALLHGDLRPLALAELRGLRGARARYLRARQRAEEIAREIASPAGDAAPAAEKRRSGPRPPGRAAPLTVELRDLVNPLVVEPELDEITLAVMWDRRPLGAVTLPVRGGVLGIDRVCDAVVRELGGAMLERSWSGATTEAHRMLTEVLRRAPRSLESTARAASW